MVGAKALLLAASVAGVSAFVPPAPLAGSARVVRRAGQVDMYSADKELAGVKWFPASPPYWDPLKLAKDQATFNKYRHSELKHGRTAMLAVFGWFFAEKFHPFYDGKLSANPLTAAFEVPTLGWLQIFVFINVIEWLTEKIGALPNSRPGDYLGTGEWVEVSDEGWDNYQAKEINNGRLAMVAILGLIAADIVTGQGAHEQLAAQNVGLLAPFK